VVSDRTGRVFDARDYRFGRFYEEFEAGDVYRHWPGKTVTEAEDHLFCLLTLAASPVHTDAHYAATTMPGGRNLVVGATSWWARTSTRCFSA
jgi:acyl dehydratase